MKSRILTIIFLLTAVSSFSQLQDNHLRVQGNAIISEIPELMLVDITINSKDTVYSKCSDLLVTYYNQLEKAFARNGISKENLKSSGLNITESYSWSQKTRTREQDGYSGSLTVILELPYNSNSLNTVMKTLKNTGFPTAYYLSFKLSNQQKNELLKQSIELAIDDAKKKASYIAESLNIRLSKIKDINFGFSNYQDDILTNERTIFYIVEEEEESQQDLNLNPNKIEIKKTIGVIWNIEE